MYGLLRQLYCSGIAYQSSLALLDTVKYFHGPPQSRATPITKHQPTFPCAPMYMLKTFPICLSNYKRLEAKRHRSGVPVFKRPAELRRFGFFRPASCSASAALNLSVVMNLFIKLLSSTKRTSAYAPVKMNLGKEHQKRAGDDAIAEETRHIAHARWGDFFWTEQQHETKQPPSTAERDLFSEFWTESDAASMFRTLTRRSRKKVKTSQDFLCLSRAVNHQCASIIACYDTVIHAKSKV